ncbi:hypothetical protein AB0395_18570 [Streptosporangium sp. NPDC051023]|uniref:hypothetical protein n=1 Tax=Streptosporangium sp. NPDC051023 TaxID=3155410 RepID=UPI00344E7371
MEAPSVDHDLLRTAALNLRPATARELGIGQKQTGDYYAARIPGYAGQPTGIPAGMIYLPLDRTGNCAAPSLRCNRVTPSTASADGYGRSERAQASDGRTELSVPSSMIEP